jgi:hypothetical protein
MLSRFLGVRPRPRNVHKRAERCVWGTSIFYVSLERIDTPKGIEDGTKEEASNTFVLLWQ